MGPNGVAAGMIPHPTLVLHREEDVKAWFVSVVVIGLVRIECGHSSADFMARKL